RPPTRSPSVYNHPKYGDLSGPVLTDYCAVQPCTRIRVSDAVTEGREGKFLLSEIAAPTSNQQNGEAHEFLYQGNEKKPEKNAFYDGVIVRSPFYLDIPDPSTSTLEGWYQEGVPRPTKMAKIIDGTSKTLLVTEKYVRSDAYGGGWASDDTGFTDGWDPDT